MGNLRYRQIGKARRRHGLRIASGLFTEPEANKLLKHELELGRYDTPPRTEAQRNRLRRSARVGSIDGPLPVFDPIEEV